MYSNGLLLAFLAPLAAASYGPLNFKADFGPSPAPFHIDVDPEFIDQTKIKSGLSRFPTEVQGVPPFDDGPTLKNMTDVRDYWFNEYDWAGVQAELNQKYKMFTTTVNPNTTDYPHDVKLHFVHHRSNRSDAMPLLFMHGWPGSFMEVGNIIDPLTNPPNASLPAFHVVTPSIPGIGFSPAPQYEGLGPVIAGHAFHALMLQLGYDKYVMQGGDYGAITLRVIASAFPDNVVSALSNFWPAKPTDEDRAAVANGTASSDAKAYIGHYDNFVYNESGYRLIQQTAPLQLATGLTDSPVGNAMWIYQLMAISVTTPNFWDLKTIITWTMMYYIQGPYAGARFYKEARHEGLWDPNLLDIGTPPSVSNITSPVAISEFPGDLWYDLPLEWAQRGGNNVVVMYRHNEGGHFAATEVPNILLGDIWTFFGNKTLSNTVVFSQF